MSETANIDNIDLSNGNNDGFKVVVSNGETVSIRCINNHKIAERNENGKIEIKCHRCKHVTEVK